MYSKLQHTQHIITTHIPPTFSQPYKMCSKHNLIHSVQQTDNHLVLNGLAAHLFIYALIKQNKTRKKNKANKQQKRFQLKTSTCRDGTLKNQPNKIGTTPQYFYTIPTSCAILPTVHTIKPFAHQLHPQANKPPYSLQLASYPTTQLSLQTHQHGISYGPTHYCSHHSLPLYKTALTCHAQQLQKPTTYTTHPNTPHRLSTATPQLLHTKLANHACYTQLQYMLYMVTTCLCVQSSWYDYAWFEMPGYAWACM